MKVELITYTQAASGICCDAAAVCTNSKNGYRSTICSGETEYNLEKRCLTGTVLTYKSVNITLVDGHIYALQNLVLAVVLFDVFQFQYCFAQSFFTSLSAYHLSPQRGNTYGEKVRLQLLPYIIHILKMRARIT